MPPAPSPEEVEEAARAVFRDPAFARGLDASHVGPEELLEALERWVLDGFRALVGALQGLAAASPLLYYLLICSLLAVLLLLLWHMAVTLRAAFAGGVLAGDESSAEDAAERARRFRDLRREAEGLAAAGERREALRVLLLALLALLSEERVLRVARSQTPREVLSRLEDRVGERLGSFGRAVEEALYGGADVGADDFTACADTVDALARQVRRA
ncbi:MAG: DUF4129 domain-containing protein [Planctomycetota bacterium]|nr:MAG: DUF4129 domain-containing protein [Planctomycetota bacterium]